MPSRPWVWLTTSSSYTGTNNLKVKSKTSPQIKLKLDTHLLKSSQVYVLSSQSHNGVSKHVSRSLNMKLQKSYRYLCSRTTSEVLTLHLKDTTEEQILDLRAAEFNMYLPTPFYQLLLKISQFHFVTIRLWPESESWDSIIYSSISLKDS